jgi:cytosine/adenosine deaminase-related metal-dependent hydrolase
MSRYTRHCDPEDVYWLTLHGALDFLGNGITTAFDFTDSRVPFTARDRGQRQAVGELRPLAYATAQMDAKADAGIRFVNSTMLDDQIGTAEETLERFGEVVAHAERYRGGGQCLRLSISGAVQWAPTPETAALEVRAMRRFGVMNQPHFLETAEELDLQRSKFAWYRDAGAFGADLVFGHFVQATEAMIEQAAACGCGMSWQPTSNGRLASGAARIRACVAAGMRVGVGLDDQSCTDLSDPWQNMRMGIYIQRAVTRDPAAMGVAEMLRLHTMGSAATLGIAADVGSLEPGKFADFVLVDPRAPDTGPLWDPIATYVLACGLRNLKAVYVGGRPVCDERGSTHPLAAEASRQLHERLGRIAARLAEGA